MIIGFLPARPLHAPIWGSHISWQCYNPSSPTSSPEAALGDGTTSRPWRQVPGGRDGRQEHIIAFLGACLQAINPQAPPGTDTSHFFHPIPPSPSGSEAQSPPLALLASILSLAPWEGAAVAASSQLFAISA